MSGTIALIGQELARYHAFTVAMTQLTSPPQTKWDVRLGFQVAKHRNLAAIEMEGDWLFFLDDDQTFSANILQRLIDRNVDIVQALTPERKQPFRPLAFKYANGKFVQLEGHELPASGLARVDGVGCGCMLVRRHVFEKLAQPYFETNGFGFTDDLYFCRKAADAGFKIWVDCDNRSGHMTTGEIRPTYINGAWTGAVKLGAL